MLKGNRPIGTSSHQQIKKKRKFSRDVSYGSSDSGQPRKDRDQKIKRKKPDIENFKSTTGHPKYSDSLKMNQETASKPKEEIHETEVYYEKILQTLKKGIDMDSRDIFVSNVLQESENKEVELSCHHFSSHCLELLLTDCKDPDIMDRFMLAFSKNKSEVCSNAKASHITELLIVYAIQNINNNADETMALKNITWIAEFSDFILENLNLCLRNIYSCHVMCTLIKALGGEVNEKREFMSKKSRAHKEQLHMYLDKDENHAQNTSVSLEQIPKKFVINLKKLANSFLKVENIMDHVVNSSVAAVVEALLMVLKKILPKKCDAFIAELAEKLFSEKTNEGIPLAFLHKNRSYLVENMFKAASEELQCVLWNQYFENCLKELISHYVGNYVIQRMFDVVQNKSLFESMCTSVWNMFDDILNARHYGIFVSMASACNRFKAQQPQFTMNMMHCLDCSDSEEKQLYLVPLLLGFQKFENYSISNNFESTEFSVCLQGSLIAQAMLEFQKPLKMVASLLNMKPEQLKFLAIHIQGCHVLNSFFSSVSVGEKNKEKMINNLKSVIVSVACDRSGSLTLARIWVLLSIKLKEIVLQELIQNEKKLLSNKNGSIVYKKFGFYYFKKNREQWKCIQMKIANARNNKKI